MVHVVCAGHVNWDVTLRLDRMPHPDGESVIRSQRRSGGGSAANVAVALAALDVSSGLVGSVGDDENGLLARRELRGAGVDIAPLREVPDVPTTVKYLLVDDDGEVSVLANEGANEAFTAEDIDPDYVRGAGHLHLTSQQPETAIALADLGAGADVTVSFDPGRRVNDRDFGDVLDRADVVFVNDRESRAVLEAELPAPDFRDKILVVKHGEAGAEVHAADATYTHPGFDVEPVDTTGAGDAFAAGFVAVRLRGGDVERALEFANACGAIAAQAEGARTAPDWDEVEAFLDGQF